MKIKPQHLLRSLLLIPYFAWAIALLFALLGSATTRNSDASNALVDLFAGVTSFYTIGILLWGIPYTILTVGLFLWSLNRPASTIFTAFIFSPFLLSILMVMEIALVSFWPPQTLSMESLMDFLSYVLVAVIPTLLFGYGFVGLGVIIYKTMQRLGWIRTGPGFAQLQEASS